MSLVWVDAARPARERKTRKEINNGKKAYLQTFPIIQCCSIIFQKHPLEMRKARTVRKKTQKRKRRIRKAIIGPTLVQVP